APYKLGHQRRQRAVPEAAGDLDRRRTRLDRVPDAAARSRVHAAHLGISAAEEKAERLHAGHVLCVAADGAGGRDSAAVHLPYDQCGNAAALRVGLSALGLRPTEHDLGLAVSVRESKAQYSRWHGGTAVQVAASQ